MSNALSGRPWVIDTAADTVLITTWFKICSMTWSGYTDGSHKCIVTDKSGRVVWTADGDTDLTPQEAHELGWLHGLKVTTLGSGKLTVWFE